MKILASLFGLIFATCRVYGQGCFTFQNYDPLHGVDAPVFGATGEPLYGNNYLAELYGGATPDNLSPGLGNSTITPYTIPFTYTPGGKHGYFSGVFYVAFSGIPPGEYGWLQVRAWDAQLGNSYEEVVARNMGGYGASPAFYALSGGAGSSPPKALIGLQSFSLSPAPEPGTWMFLSAGLVLLWVKITGRKWS